MVRIKLFLSATCLITQYFTLNITVLHVFVCIKWKRGFYDIYLHGNKQKNYCLRAKKLMDNNIFSGDGENYCSAVVITIMFLCFDIKV